VVEFGAESAGLEGLGLVELAEPLSGGAQLQAEIDGELERRGGDGRAAGQGDAVAGGGEPPGMGRGQVGEARGDAALPLVECLVVGHGRAPWGGGGSDPSSLRDAMPLVPSEHVKMRKVYPY
jgi:hypothetical protein